MATFGMRGVVEGFYGTFYTFPERNDLLRFLGAHGFNFYLYGPKNDRQHRMRWWDSYPPPILGDFEQSIRIAREVGVIFCYGISFGVPPKYASEEDFAIVTGKLRQFYDRGCRAFALLLDDLTDGLIHDVNQRHYRTVAAAHTDFANRLHAWLHGLGERCILLLCPSEYYGRPPFSEYLHEMGEELDPAIDLCYTGPAIWSPTITVADVEAFAKVAHRQPIIWDNYPANDLDHKYQLHLGPLTGRDPDLPSVCKGWLANVMNQKEASKIPLATIASYLRNPRGYDPETAWDDALHDVVEPEFYDAVRRFASNSLASPLEANGAPEMTFLITAALDALAAGESVLTSASVAALNTYLDRLDEACYFLKYRMRNLALRTNILPWIEALEDRLWMGRGALRLLRVIEEGGDPAPALRFVDDLIADTVRNPRRIGAPNLLDLAGFARARAAATDSLPAHGEDIMAADTSAVDPLTPTTYPSSWSSSP